MKIQVDAKNVYNAPIETGCYVYRQSNFRVAKTVEAHEAVMLDFDENDNLVGVEILGTIQDMRAYEREQNLPLWRRILR